MATTSKDQGLGTGFRRVWTAATVSGFGTAITGLALQVLIVDELGGGGGAVGLVSAARWLPYAALGLLVGAFIDRAPRRPVLVATDGLRALLLVAIPALALADRLSVAVLATFMLVFGTASLCNDAAFQAYIPRLLPTGRLADGHARLDQSDAVAQTTGPALAGGLLAVVSAPVAVLMDAASYAASATLIATVRVDEPPPSKPAKGDIRRDVAEGLRFVYRHRTLGPQAISTHVWFICWGASNALLAPYALTILGLSATGLGLALAASGVGGLLGSSFSVRAGHRFGAGRAVIASRIGTAAALGLAAAASATTVGWFVFGLGQFVAGTSLGLSNANEMGYRQAVTPDRLQGRMNATMRSINRSMIVVAAPVGGLLGDALGFRPVLAALAAGLLLGAVAVAMTPFRDARLTDEA